MPIIDKGNYFILEFKENYMIRKRLIVVMNNRNKYNAEIEINESDSLEKVMNSWARNFTEARYIHFLTVNDILVDLNTNSISEYYLEDINS